MGDVIRFPVKPTDEEHEKIQRMRRIQESLRKINELMEKIKDASQSRHPSLRERGPSDNWD